VRILLTGVSGLVGLATARRLAGAGHEVVGLSRTAPLELPRGVRHLPVDVRDVDALTRAVEGCEAVIHGAFMLDDRAGADAMREVNVTGTANLLAAAEAAGARRLVFVSSSTTYGPRTSASQPRSREVDPLLPHAEQAYARHKVECEELLEHSPLETVSVRATIILGRGTDNRLQEQLATSRHIVPTGATYPWQLVHHDDVARFLAVAVEPGRPTGPVNLAADDTVALEEIAARLDRGTVKVPMPVLGKAVDLVGERMHISRGELECALRMPVLDTTHLRQVWGFTPAWSSEEAVDDTRLAVNGVRARGGRVVPVTGRTPYRHQILPDTAPAGDGAPLLPAGPDGVRGSFDSPIDPRFPVRSQTNLSEALPGPSMPLTIDVQGRALRGTTSAVAELLGLAGALRLEASARLQTVHGHCFYINGTASWHVSNSMPGVDADSHADQWVGRHADHLPGGKAAIRGTFAAPVQSKVQQARAAASVGRNLIGLGRGVHRDIAEVRWQTDRLAALASDPGALAQGRLEAALLLAGDLLAFAWTVQGCLNLVGGAALQIATKGKSDASLGQGEELASSATLRGVRELGRTAAVDPVLLELLSDTAPGLAARVAQSRPAFWSEVQRQLAVFGHRGPAEGELASRSFSDDVDAFLVTVGRAALAVRPEEQQHAERDAPSFMARQSARLLAQREQNRDLTVRLTALLRRLALEQGRRYVDAGRLAAPDDVFYLLLAELVDAPADAQAKVAARRAERERLAGVGMPAVFARSWEPEDRVSQLQPGDVLQGIAICSGRVTGRVRVVDPDTVDDFEPDEVLVAHVTDVGYTALFGHAGAVVTDLGGVMSHAAVIAREFAVPCVVDTQHASTRLKTGMLVEVDGAAGTVTLLEAAAGEQAAAGDATPAPAPDALTTA
jgi:nucleoside-diphosphate-sugar epimerase/phosphohistidine swiveling domain-containing protein